VPTDAEGVMETKGEELPVNAAGKVGKICRFCHSLISIILTTDLARRMAEITEMVADRMKLIQVRHKKQMQI
jgi:hypothetical protein